MGLMKAILSNFDTFAGPIMMLLYPLYASIKAIESPSKVDDQQWLTYWVLYSFVTLVELSFWKIFSWIPFWGYIKLVGACWLVLPQFNGAAFVYDYFVRNKILTQSPGTPKSPQRLEQMMSPSARSSVQNYKDTYGQNAYENVVAAAAKEARKYKLSPTKERQE